ncbi:efflux RND transporter permease subunit [Massilia sp.]|uniref:efflux RND transporter permease subunit n=1 Tax=Massilia sp. TaxID=1882437 RepID=UPI0028979FE3|nr:efflux RND transporter permease subunit [Massilia sp.]
MKAWVLAAAMLLGSQAASAFEPAPSVVAVRYAVTEQSPERVEQAVTNPLERTLLKLPRVTGISSATSHGSIVLEIQFEGGAQQQDAEAVSRHIEKLVFGSEVVVTSRTVSLAAQRMD